MHNIRVMRNRGVNAAHTGLSAQPIFGGPAYYIRNVVYNTPVALKFINPAGVVVLPQHDHRGEPHRAAACRTRISGTTCSSAPTRRPASRCSAAPPPTRPTTTTATGRIAAPTRSTPGSDRSRACASTTRSHRSRRRASATLAELAAATGQETHGIEVDYDIFEDLRRAVAARLIEAGHALRGRRPRTSG